MARWARTVVTIAIVVVLFVPVALDRDGLPLSTYPMYSSARSTTSTLVTAQQVVESERRALSMMTIGNSDDPLIVTGELRAAIQNGEADRRCRQIAARVAAPEPTADDLGRIEIVSEVHDTVDRVSDRPSLLERTVHATCPVER